MEEKIKRYLTKMVREGRLEANFGKLINAKYFASLLAQRNIRATITEKLGNAVTVDVDPKTVLKKHFNVAGMQTASHSILKKFV